MLSIFGRATVSKYTAPLGRALVGIGLTPDAMTDRRYGRLDHRRDHPVPVGAPVLGRGRARAVRHVRHGRRRHGPRPRRRHQIRRGARRHLRPARRRCDLRRPRMVGRLPREQQAPPGRDADLPGHLAGDLVREGPCRGERAHRRRRPYRAPRPPGHRARRRRADRDRRLLGHRLAGVGDLRRDVGARGGQRDHRAAARPRGATLAGIARRDHAATPRKRRRSPQATATDDAATDDSATDDTAPGNNPTGSGKPAS